MGVIAIPNIFWCSDFVKPDAIGIPDREVDLTSIQYAAKRLNTDITFTDDALKTIVKVPRPFFEARPPRMREMGRRKRRESHHRERDENRINVPPKRRIRRNGLTTVVSWQINMF